MSEKDTERSARHEHILMLSDTCADALRLNAEILAEIATSTKAIANVGVGGVDAISGLRDRIEILENRMDKAAKLFAKLKAPHQSGSAE